ncbi:MAG: energy-coupling factor transporter ATPase [Clostridia bacterium]|nr:energy-coupling factor transporter ATPase [Clostridia bacterium]
MSIEIKNLSFVYGAKSAYEKRALEDVSFTIKDGETLGIIGTTGSGKSTLIQHLNALIRVTNGSIVIDDIDLSQKRINLQLLRSKIGMLFQYPEYQLFEDTVEADVAFGPKNFGYKKEDIDYMVRQAIELVGLDYYEVKDKSPFELSGGQKRRVAIAGIIASRPSILVLDEPTAGLDPIGKREILDLVKRLKDSFVKTIIMISHNMDEIAEYCDHVIVLHEGKLIYDTTPEELFSDKEKLVGTGLSLPHTVNIARLLSEKGVEINESCLDVDSLVNAIEKAVPNE